MIVNCEAIRTIHRNDKFQLIACIPIGEYDNLAINPRYHTIAVKDTQHRLTVNKKYELELKELPPTQYGTTYLLVDIPALSFDDIKDITDDMDYELLIEIMSESQAQYVHDAYPDFVRLILSGNKDKIDVDKIYNVSNKRFEQYVRKVRKKYNTFLLRKKCEPFALSVEECNNLMNECGDMENAIELIYDDPYYALISVCHRGFRSADVCILSHDKTLKKSNRRIEYMLDYAIQRFEEDGSTYVDAVRLGDYIYSIDADILPLIKDVAINSELIHYEEERNILQRMSTYKQELRASEFFKDIILEEDRLDWDWTKYTKIKDGELTDEQKGLLKNFCESRIVILDSPAGTGKSSSVMALIDMIEDNDLSYIMMSPTGKAASRLSDQTGRDASTIHRAVLSGILFDKDVIIVDEASMLSLPLIDMIISSDLMSTCRFVFVGDSAQIPPIGLGRVFQDMSESGVIPVVRLTRCFRFQRGGASYVSTLTRLGKYYLTEEQAGSNHIVLGDDLDYEFIKSDGTVEQIVNTYMSLVEDGIQPKDIMLLVPYNIGQFGATKLNNLIQERINPVGNDLFMKTKHNNTEVRIHTGDLVMNIVNDYNAVTLQDYRDIEWDDSFDMSDAKTTTVYNGQVGYVTQVTNEQGVVGGKMLVANIEGEDIVYTNSNVGNLLLAYATNTYKFQGSQCKHVINVVIGAHDKALNRNLLYTAQTRMTDKLIEIADPEIIKTIVTIDGGGNRLTRLREWLNDR